MATSKFEPTYARQAYPCFDEPNMKATFTVHLLKPRDDAYIALSNMPVDGDPTDEGEDGLMVHFQKSVKMSTYLSCFIVSDFVSMDPVEFGDDQELRVYATSEQLSKTIYARDTGKLVIDFFTDYFGIPFPLPKLDMAAIPDFVSGAMEHWGLVTYRETALLYSEEMSSSQNKQRVATVVSHELAHSWFGNLVTMDWWNDLWLNEGFASYIEYKGVHYAEPDWQMLNQFIVDDLHPVLKLDATTASHPIVQTVHTPDEITAVFDTISYNKGAAILRMLENAVGEDVFKSGVTKYLNNHAYGNAVTKDLWDALQEDTEDDIEISEIMDTWTRQMGFPVIDVTSDGDSYILKQRRYLTNPDAEDNTASPYNYKWTIPIRYTTKTNKIPQLVWFKHTDDQIVITKPASEWIKFNHHQIGYYRVNYETQADWNNLIADISELDISDRAHLIEETFSLAQSGTISYNIPLDLTKNLLNEAEYVPWSVLSSALQQLNIYLADSDFYEEFKNYGREIVATAYNNLKWTESTDDGHLTRRLRVTVLNLACLLGHEECLEEARQLFESWLGTREPLSQDLRTLIYTYGTAKASEEDWEILYNIFAEEKDANEKLKLMQGLTYTPHESKLKKLLKIAETDGVVRSQDYFTLLAYISYNTVGNSIVWDYVRENWENLVARFGLNERYLGRMIPSITGRFTKQLRLDEMKDFFERYPEAGAGAAARLEALQTVENNINWLKLNKEVVENWLTNNK